MRPFFTMQSLKTQVVEQASQPENIPISLSRDHLLGSMIRALIGISILLIGFICTKEYTKRTTIRGETTINKGIVKITTHTPGIITKIYRNEGEVVSYGESLFKLKSPASISNKPQNEILPEALINSLRSRENINQQEIIELNKHYQELLNKIARKKTNIEDQIIILDSEIQTHMSSIQRAEDNLSKHKTLVFDKFVSPSSLKPLEDDLTIQRARKMSLERQKRELQNQIDSSNIEISELKLRDRTQKLQHIQELYKIQFESREVESRYESIVTSPVDGTLQTISTNVGDSVGNAALAALIPTGSKVTAQLLVPSQSIGFVRVGQKVRMRYQAYPYQKYGMHTGIISDISATPILQSEPGTFSSAPSETAFRVKIDIPEQELHIDDKRIPLIAGMIFDADIEIGRRLIIEWMFEPLLSTRNLF